MELNHNLKVSLDSMCRNCIKRLLTLDQTTQKLYLNESNNIYSNENNYKSLLTGCGICFGMLDSFSTQDFYENVKKSIENFDIEHVDFRIALSIPNVIYLREKFIEFIFMSDQSISHMFNTKYLSIKEEWKQLNLDGLEKTLGVLHNANSLFDLKLIFKITESEEDSNLLASRKIPIVEGKPKRLSRKTREQKERQEVGFTKQNVEQLLTQLSFEKMSKFYELPFQRTLGNFEVECFHEPIYFAGRYMKYSRTLSQSAWVIKETGERKGDSSIEELIGCVLMERSFGTQATLTASGREDVDVLCLGKGRPFYMEIMHPKRFKYTREQLKSIENEINKSTRDIAVRDLQIVTREQTKPVKEGEDAKTKDYEALCHSLEKIDESDIEKLNSLNEVLIFQKTPVRVLHRRSVAIREKRISDLQAIYVDSHHFRIKMTTQAGAYVKEFVHGDLGRTEPSICTLLGKNCDILELDVHAVNLDFPPEIHNNN